MEENEEDGQDQIEYLDAGMFHLQSCALLVWMIQNLEKGFIRINMHTTVL